MNAPSVDIREILADAGVGVVGGPNGNLFASKEPKTPHAVVTVLDTGGFDAEAGYIYDRPTIQVRVRGAKGAYITAYAKAQAVKDALHANTLTLEGGTTYVAIWMVGDIESLGYDDNDRPILVINFRIHRTIV